MGPEQERDDIQTRRLEAIKVAAVSAPGCELSSLIRRAEDIMEWIETGQQAARYR